MKNIIDKQIDLKFISKQRIELRGYYYQKIITTDTFLMFNVIFYRWEKKCAIFKMI